MGITSDDLYLINLNKYHPRNFGGGLVSVWNKVPCRRRLLVFILLFIGSLGELRVVLTKRLSKLRSFPGHILFPGGKADNALELYWQVARREMHEEIGLSDNNQVLAKEYGIEIDHLTTLPCYLLRTFSAVKPCVGFMNVLKTSQLQLEEDLTRNIQMLLNPGESSSVFSCPLRDFLYPTVDEAPLESLDRLSFKVHWGHLPWDLRSYTFPQNVKNEAEWLKSIKNLSDLEESPSASEVESDEEAAAKQKRELRRSKKNKLSDWGRLGSRRDSETNEKIYDVWGLTANILHDLAEIAYRGKDALSTAEIGQEEMIYLLWSKGGQMRSRNRTEQELELIKSTTKHDIGFNDVLPADEFERLKKLYK